MPPLSTRCPDYTSPLGLCAFGLHTWLRICWRGAANIPQISTVQMVYTYPLSVNRKILSPVLQYDWASKHSWHVIIVSHWLKLLPGDKPILHFIGQNKHMTVPNLIWQELQFCPLKEDKGYVYELLFPWWQFLLKSGANSLCLNIFLRKSLKNFYLLLTRDRSSERIGRQGKETPTVLFSPLVKPAGGDQEPGLLCAVMCVLNYVHHSLPDPFLKCFLRRCDCYVMTPLLHHRSNRL